MFRSDFCLNFYFLSVVQFNHYLTLLTHRPALYQVIQIFFFKVNSSQLTLVSQEMRCFPSVWLYAWLTKQHIL